jgi:hypothetical protein
LKNVFRILLFNSYVYLFLLIIKEIKMKKFLVFLLSLTICLTPTLVFASGLNGWSLSNPVSQGASTLYQGAKNVLINGKNVAKTSTALITPTATQVAKFLGKGVAGVALSVAVEQLLGAVDWVLDPANNQIVYTEKVDPALPTYQFVYSYNVNDYPKYGRYSSPEASCNKKEMMNLYGHWESFIDRGLLVRDGNCVINPDGLNVSVPFPSKVANPSYNPDITENEPKTLPLETVAQKVISNAESGDSNAQVATTAAAADIVSEAESDNVKARPIVNQLEANSQTATDESASAESKPKDPTKPEQGTDISLEFPVFCNWAPLVCEAAQVAISFPQTLTNWWETSKQKSDSWAKSISDAYTSTKEWFQKEPEKNNDGTQVDVDIPTPFDNSVFSKDRFSVSRQCPVPEQHTISLSGISVNFAFDLKPICSVLELARPALIACSYLYACYIVIGAARNG